MKTTSAFLALLASLTMGCTHTAPAQERALTPSNLNLNPEKYSGQEVIVQGYLTLGPEAHNIYESESLKREFEKRWDTDDGFDPKAYVKYCLTIANPDFLYSRKGEIAGKTIVVKGRFIEKYLDGRIDLGACPLPTAILIDEADLRQRYPTIFTERP
jgi:hypothetical protein